MLELGAVKKDFSNLLAQVQPWTLSHFVMWLDIKVAEYKVFGRMIMGKLILELQKLIGMPVVLFQIWQLKNGKILNTYIICMHGYSLMSLRGEILLFCFCFVIECLL